MATIELRLNPRKLGNYAFFCPVTKLHLTLANPVGTTDRVSAYIIRAIKSKTLIDVNNVINLETGMLNVDNKKVKTENSKTTEQVKSETVATQNQKEESFQEVEDAADKKNKRGKRAQANPVDEAAE